MRPAPPSDDDRPCKLCVDVVSAVLDGDGAAAAPPRNDGDLLAAVAAKREQKRVKLRIVRFDPLDDVFLTLLCFQQIHIHILLDLAILHIAYYMLILFDL